MLSFVYGDLYYDRHSNNKLGEVYELFDDVYIGEIVELKELENDEWPFGFAVDQVKVRVISVFKGDFKPGEIVDDVCLRLWNEDSRVFICTGKLIDELSGYSLKIENN